MNTLRKKVLGMIVVLVVLMSLFAVVVQADTGPKASVHINFNGMGDELCYATLLSRNKSTGPQSVWDGDEEHIHNYDLDINIWRAFAEYQDVDGYYFLQTASQVNETKTYRWGYYPPYYFKILLYYPETNTFLVSGVCERYAFDTYYTVNLDGKSIDSVEYDSENSSNQRIEAYKSYNYTGELLGLIFRIIVTIAIEMLIAVLFGFRRRKQLAILAIINTVTQVLLNIILGLTYYLQGSLDAVLLYIFLEFLIFVIEALLYIKFLGRVNECKKTMLYFVIYSVVANAVSFATGLFIADIFPQMF